MPTEEEIRQKYIRQHYELSRDYYGGGSGLSKEQFEQQHGQVWADMEAELVAGGFMPPVATELDYRAEWKAADTTAKKLTVIARRLELA